MLSVYQNQHYTCIIPITYCEAMQLQCGVPAFGCVDALPMGTCTRERSMLLNLVPPSLCWAQLSFSAGAAQLLPHLLPGSCLSPPSPVGNPAFPPIGFPVPFLPRSPGLSCSNGKTGGAFLPSIPLDQGWLHYAPPWHQVVPASSCSPTSTSVSQSFPFGKDRFSLSEVHLSDFSNSSLNIPGSSRTEIGISSGDMMAASWCRGSEPITSQGRYVCIHSIF